MKINGSKVFVTGSGGFIGSRLCSLLVKEGANVTALLHYNSRGDLGNLRFLPSDELREIQVLRGDITDSSFMLRHLSGYNIVFHLAALIGIPYSYVAPASYLRTNIEGTLNILEAVRQCEIDRMVHTSTSEVYGTALYTPIDEKHPLQGQSPYSATKIGADKIVESFNRTFGSPVTTLRPFNTYGPGQSRRAVIPTIISQALYSDEIHLGDLSPVRDFNYVDDTARAFLRIAESDGVLGKVFNAGSGKGITIGRLAELVTDLCSTNKPVKMDAERVRPELSEVFELICDNSAAKNIMSWETEISLREGLAKTIEFMESNPDFYNKFEYTI